MARDAGSNYYVVFAGNALRQHTILSHKIQPGSTSSTGSSTTWVFLGIAVVTSLLLSAA